MGDKYIGEYKLGKKIGKGSFSKVFKAFKNDDCFAIKVIKHKELNPKILENLKFELTLINKLKHKNIVNFIECIQDETYMCIVMEYCENGDLHEYMKSKDIDDKEVRRIFKEISEGLLFLRKNNVIHRDLKPHNIFLTKENEIKIGDFGFARDVNDMSMMNTLCGSPIYMAPEVLMGKSYNVKADIWSLGVILYQLSTKKLPFTGMNHVELLNMMLNKKVHFPLNTPEDIKNLLKKMLVVNPDERISFEDFFKNPVLKESKEEIFLEIKNIPKKFLQTKKKTNFYNIESYIKKTGSVLIDEDFILLSSVYRDENNKKYVEHIIKCNNEIASLADRIDNLESLVLYMKYLKILNKIINISDNEDIRNDCKNKFNIYLEKCFKIKEIANEDIRLRTAEEIIYITALDMIKTASSYHLLDMKYTYYYIWAIRLLETLKHDDDKKLNSKDLKYINSIIEKVNIIIHQ